VIECPVVVLRNGRSVDLSRSLYSRALFAGICQQSSTWYGQLAVWSFEKPSRANRVNPPEWLSAQKTREKPLQFECWAIADEKHRGDTVP
jgi:hypothetical protein